MVFLNSLPLWGTLAAIGAALPVVIHLLNKTRPRKIAWPAMMLLLRTSQKRNRQVKIEDILIMLLRALALLLAALAMLRPAWVGAAGMLGRQPRELIIGLDASYSMRHGQLTPRFELAAEKVRELCRDLPAGSRVSLVRMGAEPDVDMRHTPYDPNRLDKLLEGLAPSPEPLRMEKSLAEIKKIAKASELANRACYLVTDAQTRDWKKLSGEATRLLSEIDEAASTTVVPVSDGTAENMGVSRLRFASGVRRLGGFAHFAATVTNHGTRPAETSVELFENGEARDVVSVGPLDAGERQVVRFGVRLGAAGQRRFEARIEKDHLALDNRVRRVVRVREELSVLVIDGEPSPGGGAQPASFFLDLALRLERSGYATGLDKRIVPAFDATAGDLAQADVVILADVGTLPSGVAGALEKRVRAGAGLIAYAGDQVEPEITEGSLGALLPARLMSVVEPDMDERHGLEVADAGHPLGQELARMSGDLAESEVAGYHRVRPEGDARTVLRLASGDPFLVEGSLGRGRVVLVATGPGRQWSSLPLSPMGPVLLHLMIGRVSTSPLAEPFEVGETMRVTVDRGKLGAEAKLFRPDGQTAVPEILEESRGGERAVLGLGEASEPGFYELALRPDLPSKWVAANVEPGEGAVGVMEAGALRSSVEPAGAEVPGTGPGDGARDDLQSAGLWPWLALAALVVFLAQAWLSAVFTRRKLAKVERIRTGYAAGLAAAG